MRHFPPTGTEAAKKAENVISHCKEGSIPREGAKMEKHIKHYAQKTELQTRDVGDH